MTAATDPEPGTTTPSTAHGPHLWLRAESKEHELRAALPPTQCAELLARGFRLTIESCPHRIFPEAEYAAVGCVLTGTGTWATEAPAEAYIVGLKELPEGGPLAHRHILFAHCYKEQAGWRDVLGRFVAGGGLLLDLEFLQDEQGGLGARVGI